MEKRFTALRIIGTLYKVLGLLAGLFTLLIVLALCGLPFLWEPRGAFFGPRPGVAESFAGAFVALLYGGATTLTLLGLGEGVDLLLAIEENTRATALYLRVARPGPEAEG